MSYIGRVRCAKCGCGALCSWVSMCNCRCCMCGLAPPEPGKQPKLTCKCVLRSEVKAMQLPVKGACHYHCCHAHKAMDLQFQKGSSSRSNGSSSKGNSSTAAA